MARLLITDIGGVLVKTDEAIISTIEEVFRKNNIPPGSKEKMLSVFGTSIFDYIKNYLPDYYAHKADFCYEEFKKIYPYKKKHLLKVFPGVDEKLENLARRGVKIAVLSCMIKKEVEVNLSLLKFKKFDLVFSLEDYGRKRPRPNGLNIIMKRLGVKPEETAYVGDTVNDIKMAQNANVTSIAVLTGVQGKDILLSANPTYTIKKFAEINSII